MYVAARSPLAAAAGPESNLAIFSETRLHNMEIS